MPFNIFQPHYSPNKYLSRSKQNRFKTQVSPRLSIQRTPKSTKKLDKLEGNDCKSVERKMFSPYNQKSPRKSASVVRQHKVRHDDKLKVFIKFRPSLGQRGVEKINQKFKVPLVKQTSEKELEIQTALAKKAYTFDHVFSPQIPSQEVFKVGCRQIIDEVLCNVKLNKLNNNGLLFVYGNTGTGKTHTMGLIQQLNEQSSGIVPQSLQYIFRHFQRCTQKQFEVCLSFCEIYKDEVYDLLDFGEEKKLTIRENQKTKEPFIEDLITIQVSHYLQSAQLVNIGLEKRKIAEQKVNKRSSRGHGIITVYIKERDCEEVGRLSFVDLAGCERIKQSESKGTTLHQALHINSSLSALETLLMNISEKTVRNYRSNKLTRLLQPYFQFGKIRLFVTTGYDSTQSIQFAKRCKGIKFLERQIKKPQEQFYQTPRRESKKLPKDCPLRLENKNKLEKVTQKFMERQKELLKCISGLVSVIKKISQSSMQAINRQSASLGLHIPSQLDIYNLGNTLKPKIQLFEQREFQLLQEQESFQEQSSSKLSGYSSLSTDICNFSSFLKDENGEFSKKISEKVQEITKTMQQTGYNAYRNISKLLNLCELRNNYKKQWLACQVKNELLSGKNEKFQQAIGLLVEQIQKKDQKLKARNVKSSRNGCLDTDLVKKLKEVGIQLQEDNSQNDNLFGMKKNKPEKGKQPKGNCVKAKKADNEYEELSKNNKETLQNGKGVGRKNKTTSSNQQINSYEAQLRKRFACSEQETNRHSDEENNRHSINREKQQFRFAEPVQMEEYKPRKRSLIYIKESEDEFGLELEQPVFPSLF